MFTDFTIVKNPRIDAETLSKWGVPADTRSPSAANFINSISVKPKFKDSFMAKATAAALAPLLPLFQSHNPVW